MDWNQIVDSLGGGLSAIAIAGLAFTVYKLALALNASWEKRMEREREHSAELLRTIEAVRQIGGN